MVHVSVYESNHARAACFDSLDLPETDSRFRQVEPAHPLTLDWLFEDPNLDFESWLRNRHGLYWIKGKPGSGKLTLMKHIYNDRRTIDSLAHGESEKAKAAFFFHDRGSDVQKSFEGVLHSMLFQILQQVPSLVPSILQTYRRKCPDKWTLVFLQDALNSILQQEILRVDICLFIDALDEYKGKHEDMAIFLANIIAAEQTTHTKIKVCFSSRPLNIFLDHFRGVLSFSLHEYTKEDISGLVESRMEKNPRMMSFLKSPQEDVRIQAEKLSTEICSPAQGVFLWVKLVLDEVLRGYTDGDSIEQLNERLSAIPDDLEELYQRVLTNIPLHYQKESFIMLQLIQCSSRPFTLHEFTEAFLYSSVTSITDKSPCLAPGDHIIENMERKIKSRCLGFIELQPSNVYGHFYRKFVSETTYVGAEKQWIQLMHQTVKEYLQKPGTQLVLIDTITSSENNGYCRMMKYLLGLAYHSQALKDNWRITTEWLMHLILYARHAEETTEQSQAKVLSSFGDHKMNHLFRIRELSEWSLPTTMPVLYFAAIAGMPLLLEDLLCKQDYGSRLEVQLLHVAVAGASSLDTYFPGRTRLGLETSCNHVKVISFLLNHGVPLDGIWNGISAFERLLYLCVPITTEVAAVFLAHGQDPNILFTERENNCRYRPLHMAARCREISLARILLKSGAIINELDSEGHTPLDTALTQLTEARLPEARLLWQRSLRLASLLLDHGGRVAGAHTLQEIAGMKSRGPRRPQNCRSTEDFETLEIDPRILDPPRLDAVDPTELCDSQDIKTDPRLPDQSHLEAGASNVLFDGPKGLFRYSRSC